ncbi:MAG: hypothetical protein UW07_C0040G0013 [Candidatus Nomurabacteria bacterium GW2011_GWF2_43_8]|uniref:ParB/Sulfiredoxin domain-containing protein n=3 Tax=Candidatus Nomuraibacteriota TaxID=1752729 RepID=A0A0G1FJT1_9BACT|nr:MAG: hypothetical protein UV76_C0001G0046 [Candidatus Nomurabacteria bacterium GW2011_GWA2_43_15]KKT19241.1 MAG: hypothetical protein UW02_C0013G0024 [Candidatus Nomurabacteria bacterium GW2011_GWB1_43_7]KKT22263.1 MAG: hypothetical protein UW07_C0040G0013 [Candidatus Nomurabacteria bacterium GW2011_GWF2_43_8]
MKNRIEDPIIQRFIPAQSIRGKDDHVFSSNGLEVDVYRLIHLAENVPVVEVSVEELSRALRESCWSDENGKRISPTKVMKKYEEANRNVESIHKQYPEIAKHVRQIIHADLSHPIILFEGRVVDGIHRLTKAVLQGDRTVKAKILDSIPEDAILKKP